MVAVKRCRVTIKKLLLAVIVMSVITYFGIIAMKPVHYEFTNAHFNAKCTLPSLDPFDPSIKEFYSIPDPLVCDPTPPLVVVDGQNTLRFNTDAFGTLKISTKGNIVCKMRAVARLLDDYNVDFDPAVDITLPLNLTHDFVRVTCKNKQNDVILYDNVLTAVSDVTANENVAAESVDDVSVMLFGLDSVSRSASVRYLPKMRQYLESIGAFDFKGYMKVGDNSIPNILPLTSGKTLNEEESPNFGKEFFDTFPFIWKNFSRNNYATMLAEDMPHIAVFNTGYKGFSTPSTDHYMRPFWLGLAKANTVQYKMSGVYRFLEDKGVNLKKTSVFCNQDSSNHAVFLRYLRQFLIKYRNKRKYLFTFLTELAHNFINFLNYGDEDFVNFFKWMKKEGDLDKMVLFVFSDHGSRFEKLRNTYIGRIESRMPMLLVLIPEWMQKKYPELKRSIEINSQRLVTVYDLYQTTVDILHKHFKKPSVQVYKNKVRGISLFRTVPEDRSCADAAVPETFCACYKSSAINVTNNAFIHKMAEDIVQVINTKLSSHPQCQKLSLSKVFSAAEVSLGLQHVGTSHNTVSFYRLFKPEGNRHGYTVGFETIPGNARFEASCEYSLETGLKITGDIDRTNRYGNQSTCVNERSLKAYCFC